MKRLAGKVVIITGASSGIGEATAIALAAEGAAVVLAARRRDRLEALRETLQSSGGQALVLQVDMTEPTQVQQMVKQACDHFGRVDILINNAGVMLNSPVLEADIADVERVLYTNVLGLMVATHAVLPMMKSQGRGHIVNISSIAAGLSSPGSGAYSASKAAVNAFSESLRKEHHRDNIRVTVISPGIIATELPEHIPNPAVKERFVDFMAGLTPLQAEDIAQAVLYAVTQPDRVAVNQITIRPTDQLT